MQAPLRCSRRKTVGKAGILGLAIALLTLIALASMVQSNPHPSSKAPAIAAARSLDSADAADAPDIVLPVVGVSRAAIADTWGQAREAGAREHHGTDIMAPPGARVVASVTGTIEKLFQSRAGGTTLYQRTPDGRWSLYYAHLAGYAPGIEEGKVVQAGQTIGFVGDTGNAGAGNTHLHFGLSRMAATQGWWTGRPVNPYPLLARARPPR